MSTTYFTNLDCNKMVGVGNVQKSLCFPLDGKTEYKEEKAQKKPVTYSYPFFHIIFSLTSMYVLCNALNWLVNLGG